MTRRYGWIPDPPDVRDRCYSARRPMVQLPKKANLYPNWPQVLDQSILGSCVWNSAAAHFLYNLSLQSDEIFLPSRLFGYYNTRKLEGTVKEDAGCIIRDAIKVLVKQGVCDETLWPYDVAKFTQKPPAACYRASLKHQVEQYARIPRDLDSMRQCLAEGFPFLVGITLYSSFESKLVARTGLVPLPNPDREQELGGHCVVVTGYDDDPKRFNLVNSWGTGWGDHGFFTLPYEYLTDPDLADDFWTIRLVEG